MEPIWKPLRSTSATETWNNDFRGALKSAVCGRQWTQHRCWAAGWDMQHNKCLFCVHQCSIQEPLVPASVRGREKPRDTNRLAGCDQCVSRVLHGLQGSAGASASSHQSSQQFSTFDQTTPHSTSQCQECLSRSVPDPPLTAPSAAQVFGAPMGTI